MSESALLINNFIHSQTQWGIEGCYANLLNLLVSDACKMIFLNPGVLSCIQNCKSRPWEPHKYKSEEQQNKNLEMLIHWVKDYKQRDDEFSLTAHRQLFDNFTGKKVEFNSNKSITLSSI